MNLPPSPGRRRPQRWIVALAVGFLIAGCGSAGERSGGSEGRNVISLDDIEELSGSYGDAYQIVDRLRPRWLRSRGATSLRDPRAGYPVVYIDGLRFGALQTLREIDAQSVERMELLSSSAATTRFGTGHMGGAILVTSRR
jgi:hypothetical protein